MAPPLVTWTNLDPALQLLLASTREAVRTNLGSASAWGRYGQALDAADFGTAAVACYAEASARDPGSARWPHLLGLRQLREQPEAALASLGRAIERSGPTNDASRLRRAQALMERGLWGDATNQLQSLLEANPGHPAARLELARARLAMGQFQDVPALLAPCLSNPYTARPAHVLFGQARLRQGNGEAAERHAQIAARMPKPFDWPDPFLREVQELRSDGRKVAEQANQQLQQQRLSDAESAVATLLARSPDDPEGLLLLGRIRLRQRRCPEAEALFLRHLAVRPESPNGHFQRGMACYCQSHWEDAARAFQKAVDLKPDFGEAHFNLGLAHARRGDRAAALASLREALRCNPGDASIHGALAEETWRSGDAPGALRHLEQAQALAPDAPRWRALRERIRAARDGAGKVGP